MSTSVLQYPPSPSARSNTSFLSADHNTSRDSNVSTSASYQTAFAGAQSSSSPSISLPADEMRESSDAPGVNPIHMLANSASNASSPVHITRVSQDTVYLKSADSGAPKVAQLGQAMAATIDHGAQRLVNRVVPMVSSSKPHSPPGAFEQPHYQPQMIIKHSPPTIRANSTVVEGPNGLTPPPSPPSEGFRLAADPVVLDGPLSDEPMDTTVPHSVLPTHPSSDAYVTSARPHLPSARHTVAAEDYGLSNARRASGGGRSITSLSSNGSSPSFAYPRVTRDANLAPPPPSSFAGPGLSHSAPSGPSPLERTQSYGESSSMYSGTHAPSSSSAQTITSPPTSFTHASGSNSRLHPSSALQSTSLANAMPPNTRRNTTGSVAHSRSRSLNFPSSEFSADGSAAGPSSGISHRDDSLDSDILKEAEQIRRERNSKRAREARDRAAAQAEAEAKLTAAHPSVTHPEAGLALVDSTASTSRHVVGGAGHRDSIDSTRAGGALGVMDGAAQTSAIPKPEEDKVLVGNLIGEDHVNYVLMYNMLTGIRIGVSRCEAKPRRALTPEDYSASHKYSFDIVGNELTPSAKYDFKFKDYAPLVFREMRVDNFYLDPADYLLSLTSKYILSELGSPGKSGSFFYFSRDYRFIIKTIHHTEHKFLRKILPLYHNHVKTNPHSLLSRFYGLHRVKLPRGRKIHFVIMNNLFPPHRDIHETYDLKGSTVGREYPEAKAKDNPRAVLKDNNWINRGRVIELGPEKRALLTEQIKRDAEFLKEVNVMDYSLLIGIHNMQRGNRENIRRNTLKVFKPDNNFAGSPNARRRRGSTATRPESGEGPNLRRRDRDRSTDAPIGSLSSELPGLNSTDRQHFIFYQDEGGYRATDDQNAPLDQIYYLGIIDITTPYNTLKKAEHIWKGLGADIHKISPVPAAEYATRFFDFLTSSMRGGGGLNKFRAKSE